MKDAGFSIDNPPSLSQPLLSPISPENDCPSAGTPFARDGERREPGEVARERGFGALLRSQVSSAESPELGLCSTAHQGSTHPSPRFL